MIMVYGEQRDDTTHLFNHKFADEVILRPGKPEVD